MRPKAVAKWCVAVTLLVVASRLTGLTLYLYERSYERQFSYGLPDEEVRRAVAQLLSDRKPHLQPLADHQSTAMRIDSMHKCKDGLGRAFEPIRLIVVVKSALDHFANRRTIRNTWGWEDRFSDVVIRRVFLVGLPRLFDDADLQSLIDAEQEKHMDLVQGEFVDSYYNNTLKTLLGLDWVMRFCPSAEYALFVDDDYYVSIKNALRFLRRPSTYPEHLKRALLAIITPKINVSASAAVGGRSQNRRSAVQELDDDEDESATSAVDLYVGYRFFSKPHRWKLSKFFVSLEEYPYDRFPPYITAGAYLMSHSSVAALHYASLYVAPFRFDDVFLGILARKAGIRPTHNDNFHFYRPDVSGSGHPRDMYAYLIATHGFGDPEELETVWNEQRSIGNA